MAVEKLTEKDFLVKYRIDKAKYDATGLKYQELLKIKDDFESKFQGYDDAGASLVRILLRYEGVHSVKYRVKDSEHLIEKIIRKRIEKPDSVIDLTNYENKIQDLIGIRILHLFKSDWKIIHEKLKEDLTILQRPEANIRKGDQEAHFKTNGCKVKIHKAGYRSVHYIVRYQPTKKGHNAEIQVRTIFEEAWSEVDHKIRYPYFLDNELINQYLQIFNRLAGGADEMADYVNFLKAESIVKDQLIAQRDHEIDSLKAKLQESSLDEKVKKDLVQDFDKITNFKISAETLKKIEELTQHNLDFNNFFEVPKIKLDVNLPSKRRIR